MQTDDEFYRLATEFPRALVALLAGGPPPGAYSMKSLTFKDVERRLDLGFEPERPDDDWWLVEASDTRTGRWSGGCSARSYARPTTTACGAGSEAA